jgi:hypothetical protein
MGSSGGEGLSALNAAIACKSRSAARVDGFGPDRSAMEAESRAPPASSQERREARRHAAPARGVCAGSRAHLSVVQAGGVQVKRLGDRQARDGALACGSTPVHYVSFVTGAVAKCVSSGPAPCGKPARQAPMSMLPRTCAQSMQPPRLRPAAAKTQTAHAFARTGGKGRSQASSSVTHLRPAAPNRRAPAPSSCGGPQRAPAAAHRPTQCRRCRCRLPRWKEGGSW